MKKRKTGKKFSFTPDMQMGMMILLILIVFAVLFLMCIDAMACTADVGTATTDVYVRDKDGWIVGSLRAGDRVIVSGRKDSNWCIVDIGGETLYVYGEYLDIEKGAALDEAEYMERVRDSKSAGKTVRDKTKHKIRGSVFEDVEFW